MDKDVVILSQHLLKLKQDLAYYLNYVNTLRGECQSQKEAWEKTEEELTKTGLDARYSSYESFRAGQSQFRNRGKI